MHKIFTITALGVILLLAACGEESYVASPAWKATDKHLSCDQLLLEMNDAKFWQTIALDNKKAGIIDYLWPVGYIETRASAEEAIASTSARIRHLQNIYQIKGCARPYEDTPVPAPF